MVPCGGVEVFRSPGHGENFEDCIKSREKPIMNIEAGVRVSHLCILGNLSFALGRKFEWDPVNERILNDDEANRLLSRPGRTHGTCRGERSMSPASEKFLTAIGGR